MIPESKVAPNHFVSCNPASFISEYLSPPKIFFFIDVSICLQNKLHEVRIMASYAILSPIPEHSQHSVIIH